MAHDQTNSGPRYRFTRAVAAIMYEVYLPKKAAFQGPLFAALTNGHNRHHLREHFTRNGPKVADMMESQWPELFGNDATAQKARDTLIDKITETYGGYSMYEVDGVFFGPKSQDEERTQIIRLFFEYKPAAFEGQYKPYRNEIRAIRRFIQAPITSLEVYQVPTEDEKYMSCLRDAEDWMNLVGMFVSGYILYEIADATKKANLEQAEIWTVVHKNPNLLKLTPSTSGETPVQPIARMPV